MLKELRYYTYKDLYTIIILEDIYIRYFTCCGGMVVLEVYLVLKPSPPCRPVVAAGKKLGGTDQDLDEV